MTSPRVLVAPNSFKGTMSASTVADALAEGVMSAVGVATICPLADGGEGTTAIMHAALGGDWLQRTVTGPLGEPVTASYLVTDGGRTAVIDTASASGLTLVPLSRRADGGGLRRSQITILCDVRTPFEDAGIVYARQKGADAAAVIRLTARLHALAATFPRDPRGLPATGAGGGLSGALWAVHGADLVSGIDAVLDAVGFEALLAAADAVITGGRLDAQTAQGKVISGVTSRCARFSVPIWAVVGQSQVDKAQADALSLAGVLEAKNRQALRLAAGRITAALPTGRKP